MKLEELDFADIELFTLYIGILDTTKPMTNIGKHELISDWDKVTNDISSHCNDITMAIDYKNVSERTKLVLDKAKERFEKDTGIKFTWY